MRQFFLKGTVLFQKLFWFLLENALLVSISNLEFDVVVFVAVCLLLFCFVCECIIK